MMAFILSSALMVMRCLPQLPASPLSIAMAKISFYLFIRGGNLSQKPFARPCPSCKHGWESQHFAFGKKKLGVTVARRANMAAATTVRMKSEKSSYCFVKPSGRARRTSKGLAHFTWVRPSHTSTSWAFLLSPFYRQF